MNQSSDHVVVPKVTKMRVIEAVVISVISAIISSAFSLYVTVNVIKTDLDWLKGAVNEIKAENRSMSDRLWELRQGK